MLGDLIRVWNLWFSNRTNPVRIYQTVTVEPRQPLYFIAGHASGEQPASLSAKIRTGPILTGLILHEQNYPELNIEFFEFFTVSQAFEPSSQTTKQTAWIQFD